MLYWNQKKGVVSMYYGPSGGFFSDFGFFGIVFAIFFVLFICFFIFIISQGVREWRKNNNSPKLTVSATVVAKRMEVHGKHASTWYHATFQVESGDRIELTIDGNEYGQLVEGDQGSLTFQGTRYLSFKRG